MTGVDAAHAARATPASMPRGRRWLFALVVAVTAFARATSAAAGPSTSARTAAVVVRVMAYDRTLAVRAGARADLLVLTTPDRMSAESAAFGALEHVGVQGLPLLITTAAPQSADELRAIVIARHAEAVYVDSLADTLWPALLEVARRTSCLVFVPDRDGLQRGGHVAVVEDAGRTRLVVALPALRAARLELAADLLKLAEVHR